MKGANRMTNLETALTILSQNLPTLRQALTFKGWLENRDYAEMGAIGYKFEPNPHFEAIANTFEATTFHVMEGRYHWDTNLLNYFRRRATDRQWLESFTE